MVPRGAGMVIPWRRTVHLLVALGITGLWMVAGWSGYLLPRDIPREGTAEEAAALLRFVLLHMLFPGVVLTALLAIVAWRHVRMARRIAPRTGDIFPSPATPW